MAQAVGNLYVKLSANTSQFATGMKKAGGAITGLAAKARGAMRGISGFTAMLTGGGVLLGATKAIRLAKEQMDAERKLAAVIKATGGAAGLSSKQMKDYAAQLQKTTNFGDEMTINAMAMMATFRNVQGPVFKDSIRLAQDMSAVFGTDLKSSVMQLGKALNDPTTGLTMLTRVGITFSQAQKDQIKQYQETNQLAKAQGVILAELEAQFGGTAAAMANPFVQLKNALGDAGEKFGQLLTDFIEPLVETMNADLNAAMSGTVDQTDEMYDSFFTLGGIIAKLADAFDALSDAMKLSAASAASIPVLIELAKAKYYNFRGDSKKEMAAVQEALRLGGKQEQMMNRALHSFTADTPSEVAARRRRERQAAESRPAGKPPTQEQALEYFQGLPGFWQNVAGNARDAAEKLHRRVKNAFAISTGGGGPAVVSAQALSGVAAAEAGSAAAHALMADAQSPVIIETKKNGRTLREIRDKIDLEVAEVPA